MVSVTGRDQAIYTRQICFSDRASYPSGAWFDLRRFFDGETAFWLPKPKETKWAAAWRWVICQKRPGHRCSDKSSASFCQRRIPFLLWRAEHQAAEDKTAWNRTVFCVGAWPTQERSIAVTQSQGRRNLTFRKRRIAAWWGLRPAGFRYWLSKRHRQHWARRSACPSEWENEAHHPDTKERKICARYSTSKRYDGVFEKSCFWSVTKYVYPDRPNG